MLHYPCFLQLSLVFYMLGLGYDSESYIVSLSSCRKTIDDEAILNKVDGDDFDALLAAADRLNSVCNYRKCKTLVKTLGTNCAHCKLR